MSATQMGFVLLAVCFGAALAVLPFLRNQSAWLKTEELGVKSESARAFDNLNGALQRLDEAIGQSQAAEGASREIQKQLEQLSGQIICEGKAFAKTFEQSQQTELGHLRLEVEKRKKSESDWIHLLVFFLDHTFALHQAAIQAGREDVTSQLAQFQSTCREAARKVGLVVLDSEAGVPFDPNLHLEAHEGRRQNPGSQVIRIQAPGYRYQGQLIRPVIVTSSVDGSAQPAPPSPPAQTENELPAAPMEEPALEQMSTPVITEEESLPSTPEKPSEPFLL